MTTSDDAIRTAAEEVVLAVRQYAESVTTPFMPDADIEQAWILFRMAVEALVEASPGHIETERLVTPPRSPATNRVVWLDVGYALEVRNLPRVAAIVRARLGAPSVTGRRQEPEEFFDTDPLAAIDALEMVDGWKPDDYDPEVLAVLAVTRGLRVLTKNEAEVLEARTESRSDTNRPSSGESKRARTPRMGG